MVRPRELWYCGLMTDWPHVDELPLLHARMIRGSFPGGLGAAGALPAFTSEIPEGLKKAVRDMLRAGGFKPSGRNKPASEYLIKAATGPGLAQINPVVDAHNQASLVSGLPISVVDAAKLSGPLTLRNGDAGASYIFNPAGQVIDVSGLVCLHDSEGPCANAVKDAQRTKTTAETTDTLTVIWGVAAFAEHTDRLAEALRDALSAAGTVTASW